MTGKERILAILNRQPVDRLAWTTLADGPTRTLMPEAIRNMPMLDFYRHVGCDIFLFGNIGLPAEQAVVHPARLVTRDSEMRWDHRDDETVWQWRSPRGTLTTRCRKGHPVDFPVQTVEDLKLLRWLWENSHYEEVPGTEASYARLERDLQDDGLFCPIVGPSPVQQLIEYDLGVEGFYHFLQDCPALVEEVLAVMHAQRKEEYEICGRRYPGPVIMSVENTSTTLVSPQIYARYSLPQIQDFAAIAHQHGKKAILHMCGLLQHLLPQLKQTGMDGINALTPPPVGDCSIEAAQDGLGEDLIVLGGIADPTQFHGDGNGPPQIRRMLDRLYTPRIRKAHLLLWIAVDGLPTPREKFMAVRDWFEEQGRR